MLHATALPFLALLALAQERDNGPPPGMVEIPLTVLEVGGDPEEIEALIRKDETVASNLASELGDKTVAVQPFYCARYETTNEQYLAFVLATGHRPPQSWGEKAIEAAARAYAEANKDNKSAPNFSEKDWWLNNWRDAEWSMPTDQAAWPVVYVDQYDCEAYCRWAGLRLLTEFEFEAAGRGPERQNYTWGKEWQRSVSISSDPDRRGHPEPIGSAPKSASLHGVQDLCGNVWEWTSSPYVALPGYEPMTVKVKQGNRTRDVIAAALFDSSKRVVKGGSFANSPMALRLSTRRPTDRSENFSGLGFRCAADELVGRGRAQALAAELSFDLRSKVELNDRGTAGAERWTTGEGRCTAEGYALIEKHEWFVFVPSIKINANSTSGLKTAAKEDPVGLGILSTTVPIAHPALEPGTYLVAWRGEGEPKKKKKDEKKEDDGKGDDPGGIPGGGAVEPPATSAGAADQDKKKKDEDPFNGVVDYDEPALIFFDENYQAVASIPFHDLDDVSDDPFAKLGLIPAGESPEREGATVPVALDIARFDVRLPSTNKRKTFSLTFDLGLKAGSIGPTWRR
ncbi:MAG: SUMF1/EgtB/PvdO family nonheme iron enzyme [Planctomycetota bacterium]